MNLYEFLTKKKTNPVGLKNDKKMLFLEHFGFEIRLKISILCYKL